MLISNTGNWITLIMVLGSWRPSWWNTTHDQCSSQRAGSIGLWILWSHNSSLQLTSIYIPPPPKKEQGNNQSLYLSLPPMVFKLSSNVFFHTHLFLVGTSLTSFLMQANLGLMKVLVAKSQAEGLQTHLKSMVEGLLKWQDDSKSHFKAKVCVSLCNLILHLGLQLHVVSISSLPCYSWNLSSCFNQGTSDTVSNIIWYGTKKGYWSSFFDNCIVYGSAEFCMVACWRDLDHL